jgi:hypothetical protein
MALNGYNDDPFDAEAFQEETPPEPEKKPGNRTFLTIIIVLGIIFLIALLGLLIFAPRLISNQRAAQMEEAAVINAANTATAGAVIALQDEMNTQQALTEIALTPTVPPTKTPTKTPMVAVATYTPQGTPTGLSADELATVEAIQAQMTAQGTLESTPTKTPTALPDTGLMDEIGLPTMAGLAVLLIVIIVFSHHLRLSSR